jgi:hypothetical protein
MSASYTNLIVRASLVKALIVVFNLAAVGSFFFIQLGSIFLIVPAAIVDVMYMLNQEEIGTKRGAAEPSFKILKLALGIILASLVIFSLVFLFEVVRSS